jgi:hypothetical protein
MRKVGNAQAGILNIRAVPDIICSGFYRWSYGISITTKGLDIF